jgi:peroxiredoxin
MKENSGGIRMEDKYSRENKKSNTRKILFIPIAILALVVFILMQNRTPPAIDIEPNHTEQGPTAPNFTLKGLDGRMVSLSDHKGKVILLNIWATWCPPCVAEAPSLDKLYKIMKDEDFELMAVSIDEGGKKAVEEFMKSKNLTFPVLLDPDGRVARLYRTTGVPESFIIRKDGTIDNKVEGAVDWTSPKLIEYFHRLIQEPAELSI